MPGPGAFVTGEEEKKEVLDVLESGYLSRYGKKENLSFKRKVVTLEREFTEVLGVKHCLAVNSGTSALVASLVALGVGPGDEVIVPGYTFVASISAVIAVGATPVLAEIDESLTLDPKDVERRINEHTKVILPVHMLGNPADMDTFMDIAERYNLHVLEDACQAVGGSYKGKKLGSIGHMGAFSLNIYKVINTGDGGMLCTNDKDLYERAFAYHDQGHQPLREGTEIGKRNIIGVNMRMNELSGAFALGQLHKMNDILATLKEKKDRFKSLIGSANLPGLQFRKINDPQGECHTLLTIIFSDQGQASAVAKKLQSKTMEHSGWHVYNNMEHILSHRLPDGSPVASKNSLPITDDILARSINLSVGVVDPGIGADFGINILSSVEEIDRKAREFITAVESVLK